MRRLVYGALAALALACQPAHAQLEPGQRVRIHAPAAGFLSSRGVTVLELTPDSVRVEIKGLQRTLARSSIHRVEVSDGHFNRASAAGIGAAVGLGGGLVLGWLHRKASHEGEDAEDYATVPRNRLPLFTAAGGVVGAVFGALRPADRWRAVPMNVTADVSPTATGAALTFTRRF